jgi:hypothetical protein
MLIEIVYGLICVVAVSFFFANKRPTGYAPGTFSYLFLPVLAFSNSLAFKL